MSTILKWAGNKTDLMPELLAHLPKGPRLVEPFAGSCAVMMATDYPHYLVADINPDLINLYRTIAKDCENFILRARAVFESFVLAENYYRVREAFNHDREINIFHRAVYFLYLNRHSYRGLCRYNQSGGFNVPFGNYKKPYFPEAEIRAFAEKAKRATFICASFDETLNMLQPGDVIYCDPPYDGVFTGYHTNGFNEDDQYRLASILERRSSEGYPVVVSNSDTSLIRSLYPSRLYDSMLPEWRTCEFQAMTRGGVRTEKLWMNFSEGRAYTHTFAGKDYNDRNRIKRKASRWQEKYAALPAAERLAIMTALNEIDASS